MKIQTHAKTSVYLRKTEAQICEISTTRCVFGYVLDIKVYEITLILINGINR